MMSMRPRWLFAGLMCSGLACGPQVGGGGDGDGDGTGASSSGAGSGGTGQEATSVSVGGTADGTTSMGTSVGSSASAGTAGCVDDGSDDGVKLDVGPPDPECDIFAQDCEAGFKCVPDGFWVRVCVPVAEMPLADGEPCTRSPGSDPCGDGSWCGLFDHELDLGTCVPQCQGSPAAPECPAQTICVIDDESVVAFCQRPCDPFADDCGTDTCQPTSQGFGCLPSGAQQAGDGCQQQDSCADGLFCIPAGALQDCCSGTCCAPICDDTHPCAVGDCVRVEPAPPGSEGIGFCS